MGIPFLYSKLAPHGEPTTFTGRDNGASGGIVIDGPGLCFWLYQELHAQTYARAGPQSQNPLPSYNALASFTLRWLETLEALVLPIKYILVDGTLPDFKIATRTERLLASSALLKALKSSTRGKKDFKVGSKLVGLENCKYAHVTSEYHPGFVPPFVLSTVLETLFASKYASRTIVVPGEADTACVDPFYSTAEDIILTGDTDLVIMNPPGRVVFLTDLSTSGATEAEQTLNAVVYRPMELTAQLRITNPVPWAFLLKRNSKLSLADAAEAANKLDPASHTGSALASFAEQYKSADRDWPTTNAALRTCLSRLESRTSEVVHQTLLSDSRTVRHFLPTLLDDPDRPPALLASTDIRATATSLLAELAPEDKAYTEICSRADKIQTIQIQPDGRYTALADSLDRHVRSSARTRSLRAFALAHALCWNARSGKPVAHRAEVARLAVGALPACGWRELHLGAQVEGVLFSLRFLRQVLEVRAAVVGMQTEEEDDAVRRLRDTLAMLPRVAELMPYPCACLRLDAGDEELEEILDRVYLDVAGETARLKSRKQDAKKAKRLVKGSGAAPESKGGNMFSLLEGMDIL